MKTPIKTKTLREGREEFFKTYGFSAATYDNPWFRVDLGPIPLWVPNSSGRARNVGTHDLHHVLTGYEATTIGEAEIGAWELASNCKRVYAAWVYNAIAVAVGFPLAPRRVLKAFARGLSCSNLYSRRIDKRLLDAPLEEVRARLGVSPSVS